MGRLQSLHGRNPLSVCGGGGATLRLSLHPSDPFTAIPVYLPTVHSTPLQRLSQWRECGYAQNSCPVSPVTGLHDSTSSYWTSGVCVCVSACLWEIDGVKKINEDDALRQRGFRWGHLYLHPVSLPWGLCQYLCSSYLWGTSPLHSFFQRAKCIYYLCQYILTSFLWYKTKP